MRYDFPTRRAHGRALTVRSSGTTDRAQREAPEHAQRDREKAQSQQGSSECGSDSARVQHVRHFPGSPCAGEPIFQASTTGATGLEPATSGVTGRVCRDYGWRRTRLNGLICRHFSRSRCRGSAWLSQSSNRRLGHERATKCCQSGQHTVVPRRARSRSRAAPGVRDHLTLALDAGAPLPGESPQRRQASGRCCRAVR